MNALLRKILLRLTAGSSFYPAIELDFLSHFQHLLIYVVKTGPFMRL
jgi:hypothetical protein